MGGGAEFFELLAGEDVDGNKMDLGVAVLAGLGGGHVDNLAGAVLDHDEAVLPQGRALHGEGGRGASIGGIEGVLMLFRDIEVSTPFSMMTVVFSSSQVVQNTGFPTCAYAVG